MDIHYYSVGRSYRSRVDYHHHTDKRITDNKIRSMHMYEKAKTTFIVIAISLAVIWFIYFLGDRAVNFMVKLHGG